MNAPEIMNRSRRSLTLSTAGKVSERNTVSAVVVLTEVGDCAEAKIPRLSFANPGVDRSRVVPTPSASSGSAVTRSTPSAYTSASAASTSVDSPHIDVSTDTADAS